MGEQPSASSGSGNFCPRCRSNTDALQALNQEHSRCAKKIRNQQDMIQKLEAAAKLLNKMLHDDRRHRAFLQERLDTAEQALYLRTCISDIQNPPKHHRRKPTTSISQDCSMVSTQTDARTDNHNKEEKPDGTEPKREPRTIDSSEAGQQDKPPDSPSESAHQLPEPPFNLKGFGKERRNARKTLSFSDSVSLRIPDSSIRQDSLYDHDPYLEDAEDSESTLSESGTLTENPSRCAKPRKVADLEHPNPTPVPGIDSRMRKHRRNNLLGPTATSDDGDSGEFDSRQSPLFAGNKDLHRLTYRVPAQQSRSEAPATEMLGSRADKERRKPPANARLIQHSDVSEVSKMAEAPEQEGGTKKDRAKSSSAKRGIFKKSVSISQSPPDTFLHKSEQKILQRVETHGYREWKSRQQGPTEAQSDTQINSNVRQKKLSSKVPVTVCYSTLKLARRIEKVPVEHTDKDDGSNVVVSNAPSPSDKKQFPAARTTKSTKLKDGFTRLKYENPEQQWVSRAGPARGL